MESGEWFDEAKEEVELVMGEGQCDVYGTTYFDYAGQGGPIEYDHGFEGIDELEE